MTSIPSGTDLYPSAPSGVLVPKRGFGGSLGAHVYFGRIGIARLGAGVDVVRAQGTARTPAPPAGTTPASLSSGASSDMESAPSEESPAPEDVPAAIGGTASIDSVMTITVIAPQLSVNFGTRDGWSYLSAGYGTVLARGVLTGDLVGSPGTRATLGRREQGQSLNFGGGARWFLREHFAAGFDVRFHRVALSGAMTTLVTASVGLSVR